MDPILVGGEYASHLTDVDLRLIASAADGAPNIGQVSEADDPVDACQVCTSPVERVFHPVAVHFKGSGFYNTDYGTKRRAAEKAAHDSSKAKSSSDSSSSSSDSSSSSSSDSGNGGSSDSGSKSDTAAKPKPAPVKTS